eukprot:gene4500-3217_t
MLEEFQTIYRLRFRKSLYSEYNKTVDNISFQVEVADEFEAIEGILVAPDKLRVFIRRVSPHALVFGDYFEVAPALKVCPKAKFILASIPAKSLSADEGHWYQLKISLDTGDKKQLVLPVFSDFFYLQPSSTPSDPNDSIPSPKRRILCSNYREISFVDPLSRQPSTFVVKEDYGATIGSHVYDSSIVLGQYLYETIANQDHACQYCRVIELGAGCGLISIAAASILQRAHLPSSSTPQVFATDRKSQLPLLQWNVERNPSAVDVSCHELDWDNGKHVQQFVQFLGTTSVSPPPSTLILAADVLYDRDAAKSLHRLLLTLNQQLASVSNSSEGRDDRTNRIDTWLVYKNRSGLSHDEVLTKVGCWCTHGQQQQHSTPPSDIVENHPGLQLQSQLLVTAANVYIFQVRRIVRHTSPTNSSSG